MKKGRCMWLVLFIVFAVMCFNVAQVVADTDTKQKAEQKEEDGSHPADSSACHAHSRNRRCCGSTISACRGV